MGAFLDFIVSKTISPAVTTVANFFASLSSSVGWVWEGLAQGWDWLTSDMVETGYIAPGAVSAGAVLSTFPDWMKGRLGDLIFDWLIPWFYSVRIPTSDSWPHSAFGSPISIGRFHSGSGWSVGDVIAFMMSLFWGFLDWMDFYIDVALIRSVLPQLIIFTSALVLVIKFAQWIIRACTFFFWKD